jgi:hypothetical protein
MVALAKMPLAEQMANVGSELSRALNWQKKAKKSYHKERATEPWS